MQAQCDHCRFGIALFPFNAPTSGRAHQQRVSEINLSSKKIKEKNSEKIFLYYVNFLYMDVWCLLKSQSFYDCTD